MKPTAVHSIHVYEVRPRNDKRGVDLFPRRVDSPTAGPEGAKNLAGKCPPPDSNPLSDQSFEIFSLRSQDKFTTRILDLSPTPAVPLRSVSKLLNEWNRGFQSNKRTQLFICAHNEPLSVAAMCVSNPDCSTF